MMRGPRSWIIHLSIGVLPILYFIATRIPAFSHQSPRVERLGWIVLPTCLIMFGMALWAYRRWGQQTNRRPTED